MGDVEELFQSHGEDLMNQDPQESANQTILKETVDNYQKKKYRKKIECSVAAFT